MKHINFREYFIGSKFPRLAALLVAGVGIVNIISALYPAIPIRLHILRDLFSLEYIQNAQTATILVSFLLIILSFGLENKRFRAYQLSLLLLLFACALNLLKGLDFEETILNALIALFLFLNRKQFYIASPIPSVFETLRVILISAVLYYAYVFAGFLILQRGIRPTFSFIHVLYEPYHMFFDLPYYHYLHRQGKWFADSIVIFGSLWIMYMVIQLLRPLLPRIGVQTTDVDRAKQLLHLYGSDTLSYFSLQQNRLYFFNHEQTAFLSYQLFGTVALVAGDPVGKAKDIPILIAAFVDFCNIHGIRYCFLAISQNLIGTFKPFLLQQLKIGEEAVIDLTAFSASVFDKKVRRAVRHNEENEIVLRVYSPLDLTRRLRSNLQEISEKWITKKGGKHYGFSMTLGRFPSKGDSDCLIVLAQKNGNIYGFLTLVPIYQGKGWSLDQMRRTEDAPNGITEFLIIKTAEYLQKQGYEKLSLNFATFADSNADISSQLFKQLQESMFDYLSSVYQLKSLYNFNKKFHPAWKSRYLLFAERRYFPQITLAIMQAERPIKIKFPFFF